MSLRKGQKELVEKYRGGCCAVPAIPGGGKTYSLTAWAVETIINGLNKPGKLLIVTYMNSAVNNFKRRISEELIKRGISGRQDYFVSTIHGLCLQIIKERPDLINAGEGFEVIDEDTKSRLAGDSVKEWKQLNGERFAAFIEDSGAGGSKRHKLYEQWEDTLSLILRQSVIGDFKARGINPSKALAMAGKLPADSLLACMAEIYAIYDGKLKLMGYLDFDDMLFQAARLLSENRELLLRYQKKYTFVCEDEAQDSNLIQSKVLSMIANGNLLRVGDSNQAICGTFTNSDSTYFKDFCNLPETAVYNITQSSRSTADIIDLANYFVRTVRKRHPVQSCRDSLLPQYIEPVGSDDPFTNPVSPENAIRAAILGSWEEEARVVAAKVQFMTEKYPDKTIAVLVPSYRRMELVISMLEARGVPYEALGNYTGEGSRVLRKLGRILDFICCPEDGEKLRALLTETYPREFSDELSERLGDRSTAELIYSAGRMMLENGSNMPSGAAEKLCLIRELLEYPSEPPERLIVFSAELFNFNREEKAVALRVADEAARLSSRDPGWRLSFLAGELLSARNPFIRFVGAVWELKGYEPAPGKATVSTYHKAKGLEWDIVFLTGLNNSDFPVELNDRFMGEYWYLKQKYKNPQAVIKAEMKKAAGEASFEDPLLESKLETISEKARLLYVGITRAREYLFLSGYHENPGKRNETRPSGYLLELKAYLDKKAREGRAESE